MSKFIYSSGDRPLAGYVIKRGIGQGGFGEVYYAVSEAGKEVALKLVRGNAEVELRGMQQCINLKHQNLVALYDIKTDDRGDNWVIMEYVAGESLLQVLQRHPNGLPVDQAQSIFQELCLAMQALHDSGIVHRDLKPANVFIENGMVKVGDYGLCKFISGTQKSPQTQSIGTVHYMAPEISTGNYGKQVDIYAAGVMLYEMLTGKLPFDGETVGEILMKHLTSQPDLSPLPKEFAGIVGKALVKNPAERYQQFTDIQSDVATALGKPAVKSMPKPMPPAVQPLVSPSALTTPYRAGNTPSPFVPAGNTTSSNYRDRITELCWSLVQATIFSMLGILIYAAIVGPTKEAFRLNDYLGMLNTLILTTWVVLITGKFWENQVSDPWPRRTILLASGLAIGALSGFMSPCQLDIRSASANILEQDTIWKMLHHAFFFGVALFAMKWWDLTARFRASRFNFWSMVLTGVIGYGIMLI
ncbi:MAG TPA: serine/threonine-protein kinase, partial [Gemmatales bacterium]|nr:serine/threonine-protein kinase [Gemmatales bacterium]